MGKRTLEYMKTAFLIFLCVISVNVRAQVSKSGAEKPAESQKVQNIFIVGEEEEITDSLNHIYMYPDEAAHFPGEKADLHRFLAENIFYPQNALEKGIEGTVYLQFVVEKNGSITNVSVKRGIPNCSECDAESIRVVKLMPKWVPAKEKGQVVKSYFNLPIKFKLNG